MLERPVAAKKTSLINSRENRGEPWQRYFSAALIFVLLSGETKGSEGENNPDPTDSAPHAEVQKSSLELPLPQKIILEAKRSNEGIWSYLIFSNNWDYDQVTQLRTKITPLFENAFIQGFLKNEFIVIAEQNKPKTKRYKTMTYTSKGDKTPFLPEEVAYIHDILTHIMLQCEAGDFFVPSTNPDGPSKPASASPRPDSPDRRPKESHEPDVKPSSPAPAKPQKKKKKRYRHPFPNEEEYDVAYQTQRANTKPSLLPPYFRGERG